MKQRVITAVIALIIFLPLLYLGGIPFDILVTLMGIVAMSEFLIMKRNYSCHLRRSFLFF